MLGNYYLLWDVELAGEAGHVGLGQLGKLGLPSEVEVRIYHLGRVWKAEASRSVAEALVSDPLNLALQLLRQGRHAAISGGHCGRRAARPARWGLPVG